MMEAAPVAFTLKTSKKKKSLVEERKQDDSEAHREMIVGMNENGLVSASPVVISGPLVIPLPPPKRQRANPKLNPNPNANPNPNPNPNQTSEGADRPKTEDELAAEALIRELHDGNANGSGPTLTIALVQENGVEKRIPLLLQHMDESLLGEMTEDERFKRDLELKAEDVDFTSETFERVPVELFGEAMLRGMGWTGEGLMDDDSSKMPMLRHERLGLGATPKPPENPKSKRKLDQESSKEWQKKATERLKVQQLRKGDIVRLLHPSYVNLRARVWKTLVAGLNQIEVQLEQSSTVISVSKTDALLVSEDELSKEPFHAPDLVEEEPDSHIHTQTHTSESSKKRSRDDSGNANKSNSSKSSSTQDQAPLKGWLRPNVQVRIVSKKVSEGAHYLRKGVVVDVPERQIATVHLENGVVVPNVKEKYLETVLPAVNGMCEVLFGASNGQVARVMEKNKQKQTVIVQYEDSLEIEELPFDFVAATKSD